VSVFAATAVELFTVSAIYHLGAWSPRVRVILRRIDHAGILFLIAGTYTPFAVLALHGGARLAILGLVWGGAVLGGVFRVAWTGLPRWVYVPVYVGLGWAGRPGPGRGRRRAVHVGGTAEYDGADIEPVVLDAVLSRGAGGCRSRPAR
jgi:hypothetical protein